MHSDTLHRVAIPFNTRHGMDGCAEVSSDLGHKRLQATTTAHTNTNVDMAIVYLLFILGMPEDSTMFVAVDHHLFQGIQSTARAAAKVILAKRLERLVLPDVTHRFAQRFETTGFGNETTVRGHC